MHEHGAGDAARLVERFLNSDAIERDRRIDIVACGGEIGELAAEAEAHGGSLAGALGPRPERIERRPDVDEGLVHVEALVEIEGLGEIVLVVAEVHAGLHPPEEIGHEADIAFLRVEVGDRPQARIDPENLLLDQQAGPLALFRYRQIAAEPAAVGDRDNDRYTRHERLPASYPKWPVPARSGHSAHALAPPQRDGRHVRPRLRHSHELSACAVICAGEATLLIGRELHRLRKLAGLGLPLEHIWSPISL